MARRAHSKSRTKEKTARLTIGESASAFIPSSPHSRPRLPTCMHAISALPFPCFPSAGTFPPLTFASPPFLTTTACSSVCTAAAVVSVVPLFPPPHALHDCCQSQSAPNSPSSLITMRPKRAKDRLMMTKSASSSSASPSGLLRPGARNGFVDPDASDSESNADNVSVYSFSSSRYDRDDVMSPGAECDRHEAGGEDGDDGYCDDFEDKLVEAIESATEKSTKSRILALESIARAFRTRYMFDFISDRKMTIIDLLERSVKKGKGEEQGSAAMLSSVVASTLGPGSETEMMFKDLTGLMLTTISDAAASLPVRSKCATAVGVNCFIHGEEDIHSVTDILLDNFSGSFLKGNGAIQTNLAPATIAMHASALMSWSLLLTVQANSTVYSLTEKYGMKISELLESPDVDLRIAAGEALAVMYEICQESDDEFELENHDSLIDKLKLLATDGQKFRAKKDRRIQRSSFRDILKSIEDGERPQMTVKFGRERLTLNSWCSKRQYDSLCFILGSGMNLHLAENDLIRDIFELGSPVSGLDPSVKMSKFARHMENLAADKARTKTRDRMRGNKRADVVIGI